MSRFVHLTVYKKSITCYYEACGDQVKKRELEKKLRALGWYFSKHGGEHDHGTNGKEYESVPRHPEINELLAKEILKTAKNNPPKEE